jgi:hypothetical protein
MYERFYLGNWVGAEGMIYTEYNYKRHLIDPFPIPKEWTRYLSIDFGFTNPFVCQWWAEDNDGRLYLYRELYGTQTTVEDWAHQIHDLAKGETTRRSSATTTPRIGPPWSGTWATPALSASSGGQKDFYKVPRNRVSTIGADKRRESVVMGIQEVQNRFRGAGDGKPRLFLFKGALVPPTSG